MVFVTSLAAAVAAAADEPPSRVPLPDLVRTKLQVFSIPFSPPAAQSPDAAAQRVLLSVSKDLGGTWEQAGEAAPNAGSFSYRAAGDGEYWFRLRAVDSKGRTRGGAGPDLRVLVDAAGPRLAARVWKGADGEIICRYAAVDDSLRLDSLSFEYRGKGDQGWKKVAAVGILSRESPAHMVGEEIWWAGEQVEALTVRIAISDSAGTNTVRQFTLEPADPQVDQAALARELGAPPLPSRETPTSVGGGIPDSSSVWSAESPSASGGGRSVLVKQVVAGVPVGTPSAGAFPASPGLSMPEDSLAIPGVPAVSAASALHEPPALPGADGNTAIAGGQQPLEYRGKPLQIVRTRRFAWDYEYQADGSDAEGIRVELWSTRDGGVTWQRTAIDDDQKSPIDVALPAGGLYGFRLEVVANQSDAAAGPSPGDMPDSWVGVDDEPPQVELIEVARAKAGDPAGVVIRYTARDQMLVPRSARLLYSPNAAGPWATIGEALENQGEHRWQPPRGLPTKIFFRVEAADAAGNVGSTVSAQPVSISTPRVTGKLGGVRPLSPSSP